MIGIGLSVDQVKTSTEGREFQLGTLGYTNDSTYGTRVFIYVKASEAITGDGYVCQIESGFEARETATTRSLPGQGQGIQYGVARAAIALDGYGWLQVYGKGSIQTRASAAKNTALNTTSTTGVLDDDATTGAEVIEGLVVMTASGGAPENNADGFIRWPYGGRTL